MHAACRSFSCFKRDKGSHSKEGRFSKPAFFLRTCLRGSPHTSSHMFEHHPSTVCGWLGASGTQDLRAPRLWQRSRQWRALPWSCTRAALRYRVSLAEAHLRELLTAWPGRVAQAHQERVERALLGPAHHVGARLEMCTVGGSARARRRRTRRSPKEVTRARAVRGSLPSAFCQLLASEQPS